MIGHNPTMAYLAQMLDDGDGDAEAAAGMNEGFPTGALAVFAVDGRLGRPRDGRRPGDRLPRGPRLSDEVAQTGGEGVTMPASASAASISSREMPRRYMIASR